MMTKIWSDAWAGPDTRARLASRQARTRSRTVTLTRPTAALTPHVPGPVASGGEGGSLCLAGFRDHDRAALSSSVRYFMTAIRMPREICGSALAVIRLNSNSVYKNGMHGRPMAVAGQARKTAVGRLNATGILRPVPCRVMRTDRGRTGTASPQSQCSAGVRAIRPRTSVGGKPASRPRIRSVAATGSCKARPLSTCALSTTPDISAGSGPYIDGAIPGQGQKGPASGFAPTNAALPDRSVLLIGVKRKGYRVRPHYCCGSCGNVAGQCPKPYRSGS